jgi:guanylate kinase
VNRLVVLSGPSGVGKGTVVAELRRRLPQLWLSTSVTTRPARPGETRGVDYVFVSPQDYRQMVADGVLLEHDEHFGHGYGTPRAPVEQALADGRPALLEIDVNGALQVRERLGEQAMLVMLVPPSLPELERRLAGRATEDATALATRLARVHNELAAAEVFDRTIVNADVREAAGELLSLFEITGEL